MKNLPNTLTVIRILLIPIFILVFYLPFSGAHLLAAFIFALGSLTDWLDGYLARSLKLTTKLGAFLDPVADKLMVCIALVMIVGEFQLQFINNSNSIIAIPSALLTIPAAIMVGREVIVSALREWMAEIGKRMSVRVSNIGKIKTVVQMLSVIVLLSCSPKAHASLILLGYILIYIAAILTIWSMVIYLKTAWPELISNTE